MHVREAVNHPAQSLSGKTLYVFVSCQQAFGMVFIDIHCELNHLLTALVAKE